MEVSTIQMKINALDKKRLQKSAHALGLTLSGFLKMAGMEKSRLLDREDLTQ